MYLPRDYDAWRTRTPWDDIPDHLADCPKNDDAPEVYECGGVGEHFCSWVEREVNGCDLVKGDCTCPTPAELAADRAEARADAERDR